MHDPEKPRAKAHHSWPPVMPQEEIDREEAARERAAVWAAIRIPLAIVLGGFILASLLTQ